MTIASADLQAGIRVREAKGSGLAVGALTVDDQFASHLDPGVSALQADLVWSSSRTLAASANESLDLSGVLTDDFGGTLAFVSVKAIKVQADPGNTNDVVVGAGSNPFVGPLGGTTPTFAVKPGGTAMFVAPKGGWSVVAATGDILKVANGSSGTGVTYRITVIGTSA